MEKIGIRRLELSSIMKIKKAVPTEILESSEGRLAYQIIEFAFNEALCEKIVKIRRYDENGGRKYIEVGENPIVLAARRFLRLEDAGFRYWLNLIGIDEEWAFNKLSKDIKAHDTRELFQYIVFILFFTKLLEKARKIKQIGITLFCEFYNELATFVDLLVRKIEFKKVT
jgi:hypothetical protein